MGKLWVPRFNTGAARQESLSPGSVRQSGTATLPLTASPVPPSVRGPLALPHHTPEAVIVIGVWLLIAAKPLPAKALPGSRLSVPPRTRIPACWLAATVLDM